PAGFEGAALEGGNGVLLIAAVIAVADIGSILAGGSKGAAVYGGGHLAGLTSYIQGVPGAAAVSMNVTGNRGKCTVMDLRGTGRGGERTLDADDRTVIEIEFRYAASIVHMALNGIAPALGVAGRAGTAIKGTVIDLGNTGI